jgi:cholest-4-en-3-one 26-monooxygenase
MKPYPERLLTEVDLTDDELYRRGFPHEVFSALRNQAPVHWQPFPEDIRPHHDPGFWVLTRYDDIQRTNRDTELFSAFDGPALISRPEMRGTMLLSMDGRDHTRLRRLISSGFTPRMVGRLEEQARRWAVSIVDRAVEQGTCDFVEAVAYQLPMNIIADILGIPVGDREPLFTLTRDFLMGSGGDHATSLEDTVAVELQMFEYGRRLGAEKKKKPQDDVWTILSTAEVETDDGQRTALGRDELDLFFLLLTLAGSETTRNAIAGGLVALLDHPEQLERLRREPETMRSAVEEILRWTSPVGYFARRATRDAEIRGVPIAAGDRVTLWYPSGNRDEDTFDSPFRFDIGRAANQHMAFGGGGPHFCLGANLARFEISMLFEELLARTHEIEVLQPPRYTVLGIDNPVLIAMTELPVRLA